MRVWLLCGMLWGAAHAVLAETLRMDALRLSPEATWQRGDPAQEQEDGVYLLEWPLAQGEQGIALQVALPRQATPLKVDGATFFANLRRKWAAKYGRGVEVRELDVAGARWLACRRSAGDGATRVFQLATVHEGRAYSLLAFTAPNVTGLPKPVHDLIAGARFGAAAHPWVSRGVISAQPGREALEALVQVDAERLGQNGMLTGYGVDYHPLADAPTAQVGQGLRWFMEGFKWRTRSVGDERLPVSQRGYFEARMPARLDATSASLPIALRFASESATAVEVEVGLLHLCAPTAELEEALARLRRGARAPLERLARERPTTCPPAQEPVPPRLLLAQPGQVVEQALEFSVAPVQSLASGWSNLDVIYLKPRLAGGEDDLGQDLLRHLGLFFVYAPE